MCNLLWRRLTFSADGTLRPCCRYGAYLDVYPDAGSDAIAAYDSAYFRDIRRRMLAGERLAGCEKCYQQERSGVTSLRQASNRDNPAPLSPTERIQAAELTSVELFMGRECNLKCRMCMPLLSTKWSEDAKALGYWTIEAPAAAPDPCDRLRPLLKGLRVVKLLGGEPMLTPAHARVLDLLVSEGEPSEIALEYTTNVTLFPGESILARWEKFKSVRIGLSIDGYGRVNSLIRFPSRWSTVEANARRYMDLLPRLRNLRLCLAATAGAYNMHDIPRLVEWWESISPGPPRAFQFVTPTVQPALFSAQIFPRAYKEELARKFEATLGFEFRGLMDYALAADRTDLLPKFVRRTRELDRLRGQNTLEIIPELAPLFEESGRIERSRAAQFLGPEPSQA